MVERLIWVGRAVDRKTGCLVLRTDGWKEVKREGGRGGWVGLWMDGH